MRVLLAVALAIFAITGIETASARHSRGHWTGARHVAPLVIYQYEPGVIVRAYWRAPWRHRHYYPATGKAPGIGRLEDISDSAPEPAESFHRYWSTSSAFAPEQPRVVLRELAAPPPSDAEPPARNGDRNPDAIKP